MTKFALVVEIEAIDLEDAWNIAVNDLPVNFGPNSIAASINSMALEAIEADADGNVASISFKKTQPVKFTSNIHPTTGTSAR